MTDSKTTDPKPAGSRVIVIGGGPAGLMAAGQAAGQGIETLLLEKQAQPGRKLRITGNGRCNLTNTAPLEDFIGHYGKKGKFLRQAFNKFFSTDLVALLGRMGVSVITEPGGGVFPAGEDASEVTDALISWVKQQGVTLKSNSPVERLLTGSKGIRGVQVGGRDIEAKAVIVATGGLSYPSTGSTGDGYKLAASVGHTVVPVRPALIPLTTSGKTASRLQGVSLRNVSITVRVDGKKQAQALGEMLFTHFGLSGPVILSLSGGVVDALRSNKKVMLSVDLKPELDDRKLDAHLLYAFLENSNKQLHTILKTLLPTKLADVCPDLIAIDPHKVGHQITSEERRRLRVWLKDFRFDISGYRPIAEAIITAGGVDTSEVDPRTMASRIVSGLYFAGEVLDINGDTGGYNLQAAFSTGWLAGQSAAQAVL